METIGHSDSNVTLIYQHSKLRLAEFGETD
jgi:hypothetical protein